MTPATRPPTDHQHAVLEVGDFELQDGGTIRDFAVSYATHGVLDADGANAILVTTSLGSTHHRLDFLLAPGRALDVERWFVVAVDAIGNGRTTSPSTSRTQGGPAFPAFSIGDMVESQRLVLDHIGLNSVRAVVGASMGGMQALEWSCAHPERADTIVAMTPLVRTPLWTVAMLEIAAHLLRQPGISAAESKGYALTLLELLACSTPGALEAAAGAGSAADQLMALRHERAARPFAVDDWLAQARAYSLWDISGSRGESIEAVLRSMQTPALLVVPQLDLFNPVESAHLAATLMPNATLVTVDSPRGHRMTDGSDEEDSAAVSQLVGEWLSRSVSARAIG